MKELEALEILERFKSEFSSDGYILGTQYDVEFSIIENALKENNNLKKSLEISLSESQKLRKENYKYQKVIELVKKKGVAIGFIQLLEKENAGGVNEYNDYIGGDKNFYLTEEEFNLLKEVFGE